MLTLIFSAHKKEYIHTRRNKNSTSNSSVATVTLLFDTYYGDIHIISSHLVFTDVLQLGSIGPAIGVVE